MKKEITIQCAGGVLSPTGANFLVEGFEKTFLVDCGLLQGSHMAEESNWKPFSYDVTKVDVLFVTHAHLDHIGLIPKLIFDGFQGKIISTPATRDIAKVMLEDTASILSSSESGKQFSLDQIYSLKVLAKVFELWETVDYHEKYEVCKDLSVEPFDAGHVLGSCMYVFEYKKQKFVFTGDLGNSPSPLLKDTEYLPNDIKYLLIESVYGDRNHDSREGRRGILKNALLKNYHQQGVLVVPIFSLERTQEFLYEINELIEGGEVPAMSIFLDSPLALKVTEIFKRYTSLFKSEVQKDIQSGDDIFNFPGFKESPKAGDSKTIVKKPNPKVILAGAGMSTGGRVLHHEKQYLSDKNNTLLITGFQTPGSLGRLLEEGAKKVRIFEEDVQVKAHVEVVKGYSGHKDSDGLVDFVAHAKKGLKKVFVAMGEMKSSLFLAQRIKEELDIVAHVPQPDEILKLTFDE